MPEGLFVAVVGPSGAGKDTLLGFAADALAARDDIHFVRRVITRPSDGVSEDHDSLTEAAFEQARGRGAFCLAWGAHGLRYGLPASALDSVRQGKTVVANISRTVFEDALSTFGRLAIVEIYADPTVLADRIAARGRESRASIVERLARAVAVTAPPGATHIRLNNSGPVAANAETFVTVLSSLSGLEQRTAAPEQGHS